MHACTFTQTPEGLQDRRFFPLSQGEAPQGGIASCRFEEKGLGALIYGFGMFAPLALPKP